MQRMFHCSLPFQ